VINLYQLEIFLTVIEEGSYSAAAKRLHMTQPAISLQMRAMEDRFQLKLFERKGQRLEPTEQGRQLIVPTRQLLDSAGRTERVFLSVNEAQTGGRLTIVLVTSFGQREWPRLFATFQGVHPAISISAPTTSEEVALASLRVGEADGAIFGSSPTGRSFESVLLVTEELVLTVPSGHPWANLHDSEPLELGELAMQPLILPLPGSEVRAAIEEAFEERGLISREVNASLELAAGEEIALAIEAGAGVGFVPRSRLTAALCAIEHPFSNVDAVATALNVPLAAYLVRSTRQQPSPAAVAFWQFVSSR